MCETTGIWMWSDVYTHDSIFGDKIAIILLDTQGIFDHNSTIRDCTTIFALSILLSSVQCYNVKENIQEDDLQHLELFTEYGRLVVDQIKKKPFQKLLFIVRDWPYASETGYGFNGREVIDGILAGNSDQMPDMQQLRERIKSSFKHIDAFLLPWPGKYVAQETFSGDIHEIDTEFIKFVDALMPSLFAPKNLLVKKINGRKVRARDLIQYLKTYLNVFNGSNLPEPKTIFQV